LHGCTIPIRREILSGKAGPSKRWADEAGQERLWVYGYSGVKYGDRRRGCYRIDLRRWRTRTIAAITAAFPGVTTCACSSPPPERNSNNSV
jgi:hypothetical protein